MTESNFEEVLSTLQASGVECILIGGLAGMAHGSSRATVDVDVVYSRSRENVEKLASCLSPFEPYLRGAPRGLPFQWTTETIQSGLNFTLTTQIGDVDLLGEVAGGGTYEMLQADSELLELFGLSFRVVNLDKLIHLKRAAGRPKDLEAIAELEALREERDR